MREKVSTSVDLPLSHECKRVLAYGAEEAERFLDEEHRYLEDIGEIQDVVTVLQYLATQMQPRLLQVYTNDRPGASSCPGAAPSWSVSQRRVGTSGGAIT